MLPVEEDICRCADRCFSALTRASMMSREEMVDVDSSLLFMPMGTAIAIRDKSGHNIKE
jgi:hypothetical protein